MSNDRSDVHRAIIAGRGVSAPRAWASLNAPGASHFQKELASDRKLTLPSLHGDPFELGHLFHREPPKIEDGHVLRLIE